jgi:hypothetical protein
MKLTVYLKTSLICLLCISSFPSAAQEIPDWQARVRLSDSGFVDFLQYFQIWNTLTLQSPKTKATPRFDTHIRRARFGLGGQLNTKALFYVGFSYDGIGKDSLTESAGAPNPKDNTTFSIRDAFFTYKFSGYVNVTMGYFRPRAGKESIYTSAFNISQEKGQPNFQPRIHMVGRAIGRETGINIGGFKRGKTHSFLYDVGVFDPTHPLITGDNSIWSPLLTARTVWMIGDPEFETYQLVYAQSGLGERKGLSMGSSVSYQHNTQLFRDNLILGLDAQLNYGPLDILGEYLWLTRKTKLLNALFPTNDRSYVIKGAWNIPLQAKQILQLALMRTATLPDKQFEAFGLNPYSIAALHKEWAMGLNWLVKRNRLKLGLHYVVGEKYATDQAGNSNKGSFRYINPSIQWMM